MNSFFSELKRRNVFRVAIAYVVVGWVILQFVDIIKEILTFPGWFPQMVLVLLIIGLPIALIFSWAYEVTPEGVKKTEEVDKSKSITHGTGQKINKLIIGALVLAVAFLLFDKFMLSSEGPGITEAEAGQASIAVLPFVNMSDDAANEYFADGLSEELLNVLAKVPDLKVVGRTSSFQFKGENLDLRDIGATLGVDHILEGSVRKQGNRVRITAQLVRAEDGFHIWSETYDRNLEDIFQVQDEISAAIFKELSVTLSLGRRDEQSRVPTTNMAAYDRYLEARTLVARRGYVNLVRAAQILEEATQLDPGFAPAWAVLSQVYGLIPYYGSESRVVFNPRAEAAARRALALDPDLAAGHTGLANALRDQWREVEAEAEYRKALALNPNAVEANNQYSQFLQRVGKREESLPYALKAFELDPLSFVYAGVAASAYHGIGDHEQEREVMEKSLQLDNSGFAHINAMSLFLAHDNPQDAIEAMFNAGKLGAERNFLIDQAEKLKAVFEDRDATLALLRSFYSEEGQKTVNGQAWFYWMWAIYYRDHDLAAKVITLEFSSRDNFFDSLFFWNFRTPELMANQQIRSFIGNRVGFLDYWKASGFPPGCRAVGEDDFECD